MRGSCQYFAIVGLSDMRVLFTALVLVAVASTGAAQSHGHGLTDDMPTPSIGLPLPHIGLPLAPMGLPLPTMGVPPSRLELSTQRLGRLDRLQPPQRFDQSEASYQDKEAVAVGYAAGKGTRPRPFQRPVHSVWGTDHVGG